MVKLRILTKEEREERDKKAVASKEDFLSKIRSSKNRKDYYESTACKRRLFLNQVMKTDRYLEMVRRDNKPQQ